MKFLFFYLKNCSNSSRVHAKSITIKVCQSIILKWLEKITSKCNQIKFFSINQNLIVIGDNHFKMIGKNHIKFQSKSFLIWFWCNQIWLWLELKFILVKNFHPNFKEFFFAAHGLSLSLVAPDVSHACSSDLLSSLPYYLPNDFKSNLIPFFLYITTFMLVSDASLHPSVAREAIVGIEKSKKIAFYWWLLRYLTCSKAFSGDIQYKQGFYCSLMLFNG